MADLWIPKASYDVGPTVLTFTKPLNAFDLKTIPVGGGDEAASGIGAALVIRSDEVAVMMLRFLDSERAAVRDYVKWLQRFRHLTHQFWFDQFDDDTQYEMRLHYPQIADGGFEPKRRKEYPGLWEFELHLRTADGSVLDLNWSGL